MVAAAVTVVIVSIGTTGAVCSCETPVFGGGGGAPSGQANAWVDTDGGTCEYSASPVSYVDADACDSVADAWSAMSAGDTTRVAAGSYGAQTVTGNKASETFVIGEDGTSFASLDIGATGSPSGNFLSLENVEIATGTSHGYQLDVQGSNVTLTDVDISGDFPSVRIGWPSAGVSDVTWTNGVLGDLGESGGERDCSDTPADGEPVWVEADDVTLDGIRFTPQLATSDPNCPDGNFHIEHVRIQGPSQNFTLKNSFFEGGDIGSGYIFATNATSSSTALNGLRLINNYFGLPNASSGSITMQAHANITVCDWVLAYNTFSGSTDGDEIELFGCDKSAMVWVGNIGVAQGLGCTGTHINNVWQHGSSYSCGSDTWVSGTTASTDQLGIDYATGQLELGSPAIDAGETPGASDYCTDASVVGSLDFEGDVRPAGSVCDAGADERG